MFVGLAVRRTSDERSKRTVIVFWTCVCRQKLLPSDLFSPGRSTLIPQG